MQVSQNRPFTNTASGKLNQQHSKLHKLIDLSDLDAQLLQPQFPQAKTLKKPLPAPPSHLAKTNPSVFIQSVSPTHDQHESSPSPSSSRKAQLKSKTPALAVIDTSALNIRPAYSKNPQTKSNNYLFGEEARTDNHTIFSAILRKGTRPTVAATAAEEAKPEKKPGPAENKLKSMMNRNAPAISATGTKEPKRINNIKSQHSDIGEQINEEMDSYANESFEKLSGAYESAIRESIAGESALRESIIRESIVGESNPIRESIRESISGSAALIKESIRESIGGSNRSLREEIGEEISASKGKSKQESIEEVYQQIFEELSGSQSQSHRFKKSQNYKEESLSQSASKSFRMKTSVIKSLKYAEELLKKDKEFLRVVDPKLNEQISKEKSSLKVLQEKMQKFITPGLVPQKQTNKDIYYQFRVELNKLITGEHFESKIKKLLSFLSVEGSNTWGNQVNQLQDQILKKVMGEVEGLRKGQPFSQLEAMRQEYENKLKEQLVIQEVKLRAEMNQKLSDKDFELKKMIAELEQRMMSRSFQPGALERRVERLETESDYSIDSDNVSWKADLWELLPEFEKKKLFDKQTAQVTQFLTDVMVNELHDEALERSLDISFEFPEEYNQIPVSAPQHQTEKHDEKPSNFTKPKQPEQKHSEFLADLPKLNIRKQNSSADSSWSSPSAQKEEEVAHQRVIKDERLRPQIIKILAEYKGVYLRKKQEVVRSVLKLLFSKDSEVQKYMLSSLSQMTILGEREVRKEHIIYVRAYEQELLMSLIGIYNRSLSKRQSALEEEMKKMYDRLLVVCQVAVADKCTERVGLEAERDMNYNVEVLTPQALQSMEMHPCPIDITTHENYLTLKTTREEKDIKNELVKHVVDILSAEFAKEFPKKKK